MDNQKDQDRTEEATPYRLREARDKGQVARSMELISLLVLVSVFAVFYVAGKSILTGLLAQIRAIWSNAGQVQLDIPTVTHLATTLLSDVMYLLWPLFFTVVVVAIVISVMQTGPVLSFFPLKPDINRLNPVQGFKRLFSKRMGFEFGKTLLKLILLGGIIYTFVRSSIPELMVLLNFAPQQQATYTFSLLGALVVKLLLALLFIALMDIVFTRSEYTQRMRMSQRDVKEEIKRRDGDPTVRSRIRALQKEAAKRAGALGQVRDADVLITNPTHFAVAVIYKRGEMFAPQVTAKGAGELALHMREIARKHGIPVFENQRLARALFKDIEINGFVPEQYFTRVAKVLAWAYRTRANSGN